MDWVEDSRLKVAMNQQNGVASRTDKQGEASTTMDRGDSPSHDVAIDIVPVPPTSQEGAPHVSALSKREKIKQFIKNHFGETSGTVIIFTQPDKHSESFQYPEQLEQMVTYCIKQAKHFDVYFGVGLRRKRLPSFQRGTAEDVSKVTAYPMDFDMLDVSAHKSAALPSSKAELQGFEASLPLPPSYTVDSGHGHHDYWLLDQAIDIDKVGLEKVKRMMRAFSDAVNALAAKRGWMFDFVTEPSHILRVPGTINHKNGQEVEVGFPVGDGHRYTIEELEVACVEMQYLASPDAFVEFDETHDGRRPAFQLPEVVEEGHRNMTLFRYACSLRAKGYELEKIRDAVRQVNDSICSPPLHDPEVESIVRSACRYPAGPMKPKPGTPVAEPHASQNSLAMQKDYGHAMVLQMVMSGHYRWANHRGSWMEYTGQVWRPIAEERMAKLSAEALHRHYIAAFKAEEDEVRRKNYLKMIQDVCTYSRVIGALSFLKGCDGVSTPSSSWDADAWALNVSTGTLDLRTGQLRAHTADDLLTKLAPVEYKPNVEGIEWAEHLRIFLPNPNIRRSVQRSMGVAIVGATLEEKLDIWFGSGANGKTTTARVLMGVLGDYALRAAPDILIASKNDRHPTEIADLCGSRVVFSVEVPEGKKLAESLVKDLTGGDRKKARYMRMDFFEFEQTFSIVLVANHKPIITGCDEGIWRRIRLIPWESRVDADRWRPQEEVIPVLLQDASAILNWILAGLSDWRSDHKWTASEVLAATDTYRQEQDALGAFITDRCELGARYTSSVGEFHSSYEAWCEESEETPVTKKQLGSLLRSRGLTQILSGHGNTRKWKGIRLKAPLEQVSGIPASGASDDSGSPIEMNL